MRRSYAHETDEGGLIARAVQGDRDAFGRLYERYVRRVFRHAYFLTNDPQLAEDLTAQTFLNALEALPRYELRGVPFLAWLLRIAYNLTINHKKAQKKNGDAQLPHSVEAKGTPFSPEESCEARLNGERVWQHVRKLPGHQRQVIVMRFMEGLSYPDIAHILGKRVGAVRIIQYRALASLRPSLKDALQQGQPKSRVS